MLCTQGIDLPIVQAPDDRADNGRSIYGGLGVRRSWLALHDHAVNHLVECANREHSGEQRILRPVKQRGAFRRGVK